VSSTGRVDSLGVLVCLHGRYNSNTWSTNTHRQCGVKYDHSYTYRAMDYWVCVSTRNSVQRCIWESGRLPFPDSVLLWSSTPL